MRETVTCALYSPDDRYGCSARLEWHHAIKQQRLKREFKYGARWRDEGMASHWAPARRYDPVTRSGPFQRTLDDILGDTRNRVWLCSHHHELVTNNRVEAPLPESVWEFAREFGLDAQLENDL